VLILTRRAGESISIGDDIVITVLSVSRNQTRLGISAPSVMAINRGEVQGHDDRASQRAGEDAD